MVGLIPNMKNSRKRRKTGASLHLTSKGTEKGTENVKETVNDPVGGMGRPCCLVRGPDSRQREGSMGSLLLGAYILKCQTLWLVVKLVWSLTAKLIQSHFGRNVRIYIIVITQ